ncbi:hypothetical protein I5412_10070 [Citrobacter koseri]|uniref:hypothetical protein n=1 Tax=Citrobacter koseri TaxID=545 RepID=UPI001903FBDE|nr:hypothetical protein [Citrobacter koseri]MBJ8875320.1 hypothetical protein [Citrobacter koseri]
MSTNDDKKIDFEAFAEYLNGLEGEHICPICREESWSLFTPDQITPPNDNGELIIPTIPGALVKKDPKKKLNTAGLYRSAAMDILIMQCSNCGFIHLFNYMKVKENILKNEDVTKANTSPDRKDNNDDND